MRNSIPVLTLLALLLLVGLSSCGSSGGGDPTPPVPEVSVQFIQSFSSTPEGTTSFDVYLQLLILNASTLDETITVSIQDTQSGSATPVDDYSFTPTQVTFPIGTLTGDTQHPTVFSAFESDGIPEGDETIELALSIVSGNANVGTNSTHQVTILDVTAPTMDAPGSWVFEDAAPEKLALTSAHFLSNGETLLVGNNRHSSDNITSLRVLTDGNLSPQTLIDESMLTNASLASIDGSSFALAGSQPSGFLLTRTALNSMDKDGVLNWSKAYDFTPAGAGGNYWEHHEALAIAENSAATLAITGTLKAGDLIDGGGLSNPFYGYLMRTTSTGTAADVILLGLSSADAYFQPSAVQFDGNTHIWGAGYGTPNASLADLTENGWLFLFDTQSTLALSDEFFYANPINPARNCGFSEFQILANSDFLLAGKAEIDPVSHHAGWVMALSAPGSPPVWEKTIDPGAGNHLNIRGTLEDQNSLYVFGDIYYTTGNYSDAFLLSLDINTGSLLWARSYSGADDKTLTSVALMPNGDLFLTGTRSVGSDKLAWLLRVDSSGLAGTSCNPLYGNDLSPSLTITTPVHTAPTGSATSFIRRDFSTIDITGSVTPDYWLPEEGCP